MKIMTSDELLARTDENNMDEVDAVEDIKVICHDGEVITTNRHIQYLHGFLHFNRTYNVPVYAKQVFTKDYIPTPNGHTAASELAMDIVWKHLKGTKVKHEIAPCWTKVNDSHNNAVIADIEHFAATIDAEDLIRIVREPNIAKERAEMKRVLASEVGPEEKSNAIIYCNNYIIAYVKEHGRILWPYSGTCQHVAAESIKLDQLCQLSNVVGYTTEINSEIYPLPIAESFAEGMNYAYTYATNSSLGKKSIMYNKSPISDTETLNRLVQQMASQVENVHVGDCGSTKTSPMLVTGTTGKALIGMYHLPHGSTKAELVTDDVVKQYMGKVIYLRTVAGCDQNDKVGVCSTCGGAPTTNLVADYNVGGASSCLVLGRNSQVVLKTKHVDIINFNSEESLADEVSDFMTLSSNGKYIYFKDNCANADISFLATRKRKQDKSSNGEFLQTVLSIKTLDNAELTSFGEVTNLTITPNNGLDEEVTDVQIKQGSSANFSFELLDFIRKNPEKLTMKRYGSDKTAYQISLKGFDNRNPVFNMPFKHYDALSLHKQLETFFLSPGDKVPGEVLTDYTSFGEALAKLTRMTYPSLKINMSVLQMLLLAFTVADRSKHDYRLSFKGDRCEFGKMETIRRNRSLSVVTIASGQSEVLGHLGPLLNDNMVPHQYDTHFTS